MKAKGKKKLTPATPVVAAASEPELVEQSKPFSLQSGKAERNAVLLILLITLVVYFTALGGEFTYDDSFQVLKNPTLKSVANIPAMFTQGVWQFMSSDSSQSVGLYYRPIFNSLLIINYQLFGLAPFGWHLVSVLLHLLATWLVYWLLMSWEQPREIAALAALLFGVHPVHSESVAWISGVPDPLAAVFVLLALILHERFVRAENAHMKWQLASFGAALLALFTKEVAIILVAIVALREWWRSGEAESFGARLQRVVVRTAPFLIAAVLYLAARITVLGFLSKTEPKAVGITAKQVWLTLPSIVMGYVKLLFVPFPLAIIYDISYVNQASQPPFWASLLVLVMIVAVSLWLLRKSRWGLLALAWTFLFLLPVLNLKAFNPQESIIHDRYLYLPSIGFCWVIACGLWTLYQRAAAARKKLVLAAATFIVLVLSLLTFAQNLTWQNDLTLTTHALEYAPRHPYLFNLLGAYHAGRNNMAEATKSYQQALTSKPDYEDALSNLGSLYYGQNNFTEAEKYYAQAVAAGARHTQTLYNLADSRAKQGKYVEAEQPLLQAIAEQANYAEAHFYLGWVYQQQLKHQQADEAYRKALQYKPEFLEPRINLATVMNEQGRLKDAEVQLEIVKKKQPAHPVMLYTLGEIFRKTNRTQEAISTLTQLTNANPRHQEGWVSLGQSYEQAGNAAQARSSYQRAVELAPQTTSGATARDRLVKLP